MYDQELVDELSAARYLPSQAVARAALDTSTIAGPVLELLAAAAKGDALTERQENLMFWGMHVLAARRDGRGFGSLMRLLRLPEDRLEHLIGDAITMTLPKVAAGMFDGSVDLIFATIGSSEVEQFARNSVLGAAAFLTWDGRIDLAQTAAFLERFDDERLADPGNYAWNGWQDAIALLGMRSLAPRVLAAFRDGRLDPQWGDVKHFNNALREAERGPRDKRRFVKARLGYIDDVLLELEWLKEPPAATKTHTPAEGEYRPQAPAINLMRHVGRNDPCPCGSGRKAKRCCLAA